MPAPTLAERFRDMPRYDRPTPLRLTHMQMLVEAVRTLLAQRMDSGLDVYAGPQGMLVRGPLPQGAVGAVQIGIVMDYRRDYQIAEIAPKLPDTDPRMMGQIVQMGGEAWADVWSEDNFASYFDTENSVLAWTGGWTGVMRLMPVTFQPVADLGIPDIAGRPVEHVMSIPLQLHPTPPPPGETDPDFRFGPPDALTPADPTEIVETPELPIEANEWYRGGLNVEGG